MVLAFERLPGFARIGDFFEVKRFGAVPGITSAPGARNLPFPNFSLNHGLLGGLQVMNL